MKKAGKLFKIDTLSFVLCTLVIIATALLIFRPAKAEESITQGFYGIPWGITKDQAHIEDWEGTYYKWNGDDLVFIDELENSEITHSLLMHMGFKNNRLVYGTTIFSPKELSGIYKIEFVCLLQKETMAQSMGQPSYKTKNNHWVWQNEDTTVVSFCTNYGLTNLWYNTLWLRDNSGFVSYEYIPTEALNELTRR